MFFSTTPYHEQLGDGLVMKSVATHGDVERLAAFNAAIHDAQVDPMTRALIEHHPHTRPEHWLYVEDEASGAIVSALCLIPWTWRYEDVTIKAGEMGIVGTHEDYRRRGLIRKLVARFKTLLHEGEFDLSHIQGIPYYYRQYGYEYAIPLEGGWHIQMHQIPDADTDEVPRYSVRRAALDDLPVLMQLYNDAAQDLSISAVRDEAVWRFLIEHEPGTANQSEIWLLLDHTGTLVGYYRLDRFGFGEGLNVMEVSRLSHEAAVALLRQLKAAAIERKKPYIKLGAPTNTALVQAARCWDARDTGRYAWQIHLVDVARLLRKLAPVFERRLDASPFAGLTQTIRLDLYREAFDLRFQAGRLANVEAVGFTDGGDLRLPPLLFAPLVLGHHSREALQAMYPDVSTWGQMGYLADVLFPKVDSFIYTIY
ncbi:MAG: GNAT family N-acetyltransferase [Anaerolineae bacterium]|nr:GNAT family N-acetyltransferase [Anaerolineae bacterium]